MALGKFWIERKAEGAISLGVEDYNVPVLGGDDYEMTYNMDAENAKKFETILSQTHEGTLEEMIEEEFGIHLDKRSVNEWLDENGIEYELRTWVS